MPLPEPALDNRRFDQLVSEARAQIPRKAPLWTDHNASDPGITLVELFAWLSEQNIYRFDRLSDEAIRAFVRLVGIEPAAPGVASTVVTIANDNAALDLPARVQLATSQGPLFETTQPLHATPARLTRVLSGNTSLLDATAANNAHSGFAALGRQPRPGHALYLGFDRPLGVPGARISLHVWTAQWEADSSTRDRLIAEQAGLSSHCVPPIDWRRHYRVNAVWEYLASDNTWLPLRDVIDETRALTLSGFVHFSAPALHQAGGPGPQFFIRLRIVRGRFECPPQLVHVASNAVCCEHALSRTERRIGRSLGHAGAVFTLGEMPVVADSLQLRLDDGAGSVQTDWRAVPDWDRAGAHERAVLLDPEPGEVQSGDGLRGEILPAGHEVFAAYRSGGGVAGNVSAGTLVRIAHTAENRVRVPALAGLATPLSVAQPFAATGGTARETLASAQARAFDLVDAVDKAVTLEDIERLALATPGVPVARVRAVANLEPHRPCYPAPGVTTLVVIPSCLVSLSARPVSPLPSRALLDSVERYLEPRRLITSEIHAVAPRYRRVSVSATLHLSCDEDARLVLAQATARIDAHFDPLCGGPAGTGWPFGRPVYRSEVMALLATTPGVARVTAFGLQSGSGSDGVRCDNILLCADELIRPGSHRLLIETEVARDLRRSKAHDCQHL